MAGTLVLELKAYLAKALALERSMSSRKKGSASLQRVNRSTGHTPTFHACEFTHLLIGHLIYKSGELVKQYKGLGKTKGGPSDLVHVCSVV